MNPATIYDDFFEPDIHKGIDKLVNLGGWEFGWKSDSKNDNFSFFHKHYAGYQVMDETPYDCEDELMKEHGEFLCIIWQHLKVRLKLKKNYHLTRCYANGAPYGCEGQIHTDTINTTSKTIIYYCNPKWNINFGGETVFTNPEKNNIIQSVNPRPNRLIIFNGKIPHVARGISKTCPYMRVTLMWKAEIL